MVLGVEAGDSPLSQTHPPAQQSFQELWGSYPNLAPSWCSHLGYQSLVHRGAQSSAKLRSSYSRCPCNVLRSKVDLRILLSCGK
jgi:hypothetical protein